MRRIERNIQFQHTVKPQPLADRPENPYWPVNCEFEIHGFFEELLVPETGIRYGQRLIPEPTRPCGSPGRIDYELTEDTWLTKGLKRVIVRASKEKPVRVTSMIQILCGRVRGSR